MSTIARYLGLGFLGLLGRGGGSSIASGTRFMEDGVTIRYMEDGVTVRKTE